MRKNLMLAAMCMALAFGGVACSDSGGGDTVAELAKVMKEGDGGDEMTDEQATCIAEMTVDLVGEDVVKDALAADNDAEAEAKIDAAMEDLDPEKLGEAVTKMAECAPELMEGG